MTSLFKKRMYEMEVSPPEEVWGRLSASLDEINADNNLSRKIYDTIAEPAANTWSNISKALDPVPSISISRNKTLILWKRLAIAALITGIIFSVYFIFFNQQNTPPVEITKSTPVIPEKTEPVPQQEIVNNNSENQNPNIKNSITPVLAINYPNKKEVSSKKDAPVRKVPSELSYSLSNEKISEKTFNEPLDDLNLIAANDNYYTMVNSNGRMVKLPSRLINMAPYLQDKPIPNDYYEQMFGEGAYWKDKVNDWRKKITEAQNTNSGNSFFDMVDLIKSIEGK